MKNTRKGFTLVELLVVIAILAILATVSVVGYTSFINRANDSVAQQELTQIRDYYIASKYIKEVAVNDVLVRELGLQGNVVRGQANNVEIYKYTVKTGVAYWNTKTNSISSTDPEGWAEVLCDHENTEVIAGRAATCTVPGLTEGEKCTDCGTVLTSQGEIDALGHQSNTENANCGYGDCDHIHTPETAATCVAAAVCSCGKSFGESLGHDYNEWEICSRCSTKSDEYVDYYLIGQINGHDYGCEGDSDNLGEYKFVNGKVTVKFNSASYVFIKTGDNANWYMTESYVAGKEATLKNTSVGTTEKMWIPANVDVTLTLAINDDGTLTLTAEYVDLPTHEMYIKGSFNGWEINAANKLKESSDKSKWTGTLVLTAPATLKLYNNASGYAYEDSRWVGVNGADLSLDAGTYTIEYSVATNSFTYKKTHNAIYLDVKNWTKNDERYAVYYFKGNDVHWENMTKLSGTVYYAMIPTGYSDIIFCRMNGANQTNDWNYKWNQTADLTVPTNGNNLYTVPSNTWDNANNNNWSKKSN